MYYYQIGYCTVRTNTIVEGGGQSAKLTRLLESYLLQVVSCVRTVVGQLVLAPAPGPLRMEPPPDTNLDASQSAALVAFGPSTV